MDWQPDKPPALFQWKPCDQAKEKRSKKRPRQPVLEAEASGLKPRRGRTGYKLFINRQREKAEAEETQQPRFEQGPGG